MFAVYKINENNKKVRIFRNTVFDSYERARQAVRKQLRKEIPEYSEWTSNPNFWGLYTIKRI